MLNYVQNKRSPGEMTKPNLAHPLKTAHSLIKYIFYAYINNKVMLIITLPRFQLEKKLYWLEPK